MTSTTSSVKLPLPGPQAVAQLYRWTLGQNKGLALLYAALWLILSPLVGGFAFLFAAGSFVYYRWMAYREFGGITGDLAGWFLQICELAALGGAVLAQRLGAVL